METNPFRIPKAPVEEWNLICGKCKALLTSYGQKKKVWCKSCLDFTTNFSYAKRIATRYPQQQKKTPVEIKVRRVK